MGEKTPLQYLDSGCNAWIQQKKNKLISLMAKAKEQDYYLNGPFASKHLSSEGQREYQVSHTSGSILASEIQHTTLNDNMGLCDKLYGKYKDIYDGYLDMKAVRPLANNKAS